MVFSWFNTSKVDTFIDAEVAAVIKRVPPAKLEGGDAATAKAREQLAKWLKWALLEAKYPKSFVDPFAYALATVVASANSQREI
jgi:hypothetical protein